MADCKCMGGMLLCDGVVPPAPMPLIVNSQISVFINNLPVATEMDRMPGGNNIPVFPWCSKVNQPCFPTLISWNNAGKVTVCGKKVLTSQSAIKCGRGGEIRFFPGPPGKVDVK